MRHPGQPLLRLKQSHNPHNLLLNFHEEGQLIVMEVYLMALMLPRNLHLKLHRMPSPEVVMELQFTFLPPDNSKRLRDCNH